MPLPYIFLHIILAAIGATVAFRLPAKSKARNWLGVGVLALVMVGFAVERIPTWSWYAMRFPFPDLVFITNVSLAGVCTLLGLMWKNAWQEGRLWPRIRAGVLSIPLIGVALWSYGWYFAPLPENLTGKADKTGYCQQKSDDSCSACAATMVLAAKGIKTTEAEMARLCLTRFKQGTPPLGLYRGLAVKGREKNLTPHFVFLKHPSEFHSLRTAAIIAVGVRSDAPVEIKLKMENFGWNPGQRHAVVILDSDPKGKWLDVADPTYGRERWPTGDLEYLWDGSAVILR